MVVYINHPLIRPYFLQGVALWGGTLWFSHDFFLKKHPWHFCKVKLGLTVPVKTLCIPMSIFLSPSGFFCSWKLTRKKSTNMESSELGNWPWETKIEYTENWDTCEALYVYFGCGSLSQDATTIKMGPPMIVINGGRKTILQKCH